MWIWLGGIAFVGGIVWWVRKRGMLVEDYYEREFRDPPAFDASGFMN